MQIANKSEKDFLEIEEKAREIRKIINALDAYYALSKDKIHDDASHAAVRDLIIKSQYSSEMIDAHTRYTDKLKQISAESSSLSKRDSVSENEVKSADTGVLKRLKRSKDIFQTTLDHSLVPRPPEFSFKTPKSLPGKKNAISELMVTDRFADLKKIYDECDKYIYDVNNDFPYTDLEIKLAKKNIEDADIEGYDIPRIVKPVHARAARLLYPSSTLASRVNKREKYGASNQHTVFANVLKAIRVGMHTGKTHESESSCQEEINKKEFRTKFKLPDDLHFKLNSGVWYCKDMVCTPDAIGISESKREVFLAEFKSLESDSSSAMSSKLSQAKQQLQHSMKIFGVTKGYIVVARILGQKPKLGESTTALEPEYKFSIECITLDTASPTIMKENFLQIFSEIEQIGVNGIDCFVSKYRAAHNTETERMILIAESELLIANKDCTKAEIDRVADAKKRERDLNLERLYFSIDAAVTRHPHFFKGTIESFDIAIAVQNEIRECFAAEMDERRRIQAAKRSARGVGNRDVDYHDSNHTLKDVMRKLKSVLIREKMLTRSILDSPKLQRHIEPGDIEMITDMPKSRNANQFKTPDEKKHTIPSRSRGGTPQLSARRRSNKQKDINDGKDSFITNDPDLCMPMLANIKRAPVELDDVIRRRNKKKK